VLKNLLKDPSNGLAWISMDSHWSSKDLLKPDTGHRTPEDSHRFRIDFALVSHGFHWF
jgi:hypothetical protein